MALLVDQKVTLGQVKGQSHKPVGAVDLLKPLSANRPLLHRVTLAFYADPIARVSRNSRTFLASVLAPNGF